MPPKKIIENPVSADQVTSQWLKNKLTEVGVKTIPVKKEERWKLYLEQNKTGKSSTRADLIKMKAVDLKTLARAKGSIVGLTKKDQYIDVILGKISKPPKPTRKVNPRKIIKGPLSPPPGFLTDCMALTNNRKIMEHQKKVIEHFQKHDGLIVFHLPGSGKTLSAVSSSLCWLKSNPKGMVFVAVPGPLIDNFIEENIKKFYDISHNYIAKHFVVDTYVKLVKYVKDHNLTKNPYFLIVDEVHRLKTRIRKTTRGTQKGKQQGRAPKGILELAAKADKVMVMSGTVFRNTERDLENLVAIARKGKTENLYKATGKYNKETKLYDFEPSKVKKFFKCLVSYYPGGSKEDYPTEVVHEVDIKMPKTYWQNKKGTGYWDRHLALKGLLGTSDDSKQMYVSQMRAKANKTYTEGVTESPKADWIVKLIKEDPSKKTIIYSFFKESGVDAVREKLKKNGIKSSYLESTLTPTKKAQIIKAYNQAEKNTDGEGIVFITKATSEGVDFKGTRRIIIMEKDFSSASNNQITARGSRYLSHAHLPKGERRVDIYYLKLVLPENVPRPQPDAQGNKFLTIDERVDEIIKIKDIKENRFMDYIINPKYKVTIETDPNC